MILQSLEIENYKTFVGKIRVDNLQPGLNIFVGPNEAGKSTIADAIRTLFLERYKTSALKDLSPWVETEGPPVVSANFTLDGAEYFLRKQFVSRQRCELRTGERAFKEDEAEEQLANLLGFSRSSKSITKAENAGIPGLLWVRQGSTQEIRESAGHAAHYLRDALASLSGGTIAGGQDVLISAVQSDLFQLLTERTRRPTAALADTQAQIETLEAQRDVFVRQQTQFEEDLRQLEAQQAAFDEAQAKKAWDDLERRAEEAQLRANDVQRMQGQLRDIQQTLKLAESELNLALQQEATAVAAEQQLDSLRQQLGGSFEIAQASEQAHAVATTTLESARQEHETAQQQLDKATAAVSAKDIAEQLTATREEEARLKAALENAIVASEAVIAAEKEAVGLAIDPAVLVSLKKTGSNLVPLRAKRDATLSKIEYRLSGTLDIDGVPTTGTGEIAIEKAVTLTLPGLGELKVIPGVSDIAETLQELETQEREFSRLLSLAGVESLAEAERKGESHQAVLAQKHRQLEILSIHAPTGLEALRTQLSQTTAKIEVLTARLTHLPDTSGALHLEEARNLVARARERLESMRTAASTAAETRSATAASLAALRESVQIRELEASSTQHKEQRDGWKRTIVEKRALVDVTRKDEEAFKERLDLVQQDDPAGDVKRLRASALLAREAQRDRETRITRLRATLESVGANGLGEALAKTEATLEQKTRRLEELKARATALSMLEEVLVEERDAVTNELQAPLTTRLTHYVKRLFPHARLNLADDLGPLTLTRTAARPDALESLSWGTREQLGIFSRFAYADMLKEAGRPTLLMLDDAAVHTDSFRRNILKKALLEAAERHQILFFTCHPEAWDDLGVPLRAVDDLRATAQIART